MSQWQGYVYKHGAHLVGIAQGAALPAWVNASGFLNTAGAPAPTWGSVEPIRRMAKIPSGSFYLSSAVTGTYNCRAWYRQSLSRYPANLGPSEWRRQQTITINGPFATVYASMGWAAIGRAHHAGSNPCQIWAKVIYYNSGGGALRIDDLGQIENASGGNGVIPYNGTYAKTLIYNRPFSCPAGTARVDFWYDIYSGGYEAHDAGDRSPSDWNPDVDIYAGGYPLGMLMSDAQTEHVNNRRV